MPNYSGIRREWTEDELITIELMVEAGESAQAIARKLRRPLYAIRNWGGLTRLRRQEMVYERGELARLFGVNDKTAATWQRLGWLPSRRNGAWAFDKQPQEEKAFRAYFREIAPGFEHSRFAASEPPRPSKYAAYLIPFEAVEGFIRNSDTWVAWEPQQIADPALRTYAAETRALAGGRWLTSAELAARYGYDQKTVTHWHGRNLMTGVRVVKYGSALFFWSTDLERWTPPNERPHTYPPRSRWIEHVLQDAWRGVTAPEVAERYGLSLASASTLLRLLYERGLLTREIDPASVGSAGRPRYVYRTS